MSSSSNQANLPRWRGQAGFFEIWFVVVFDPARRRAWWLRYTTFAPPVGPRRATVWAAVFDANSQQSIAGKTIVPIERYDGGAGDAFGISIDTATLGQGMCRGAVDTNGRRLAWNLTFTPAATAAVRGPAWLDRLPSPTHVAHANSEILFDGWVALDDERTALHAAPGVQKHIWGTRRVEELFWIYCPHFLEAPDAAFEASSVRLRQGRPPRVTPLWLRAQGTEYGWWSVPGLFRNRVVPAGPGRLRADATCGDTRIIAEAACHPASLVGYVYRDPSGKDLHVAQSDVATCMVEIRTRTHRFAPWRTRTRLTGPLAAVEFHQPDPLPGVAYVPWDATSV